MRPICCITPMSRSSSAPPEARQIGIRAGPVADRPTRPGAGAILCTGAFPFLAPVAGSQAPGPVAAGGRGHEGRLPARCFRRPRCRQCRRRVLSGDRRRPSPAVSIRVPAMVAGLPPGAVGVSAALQTRGAGRTAMAAAIPMPKGRQRPAAGQAASPCDAGPAPWSQSHADRRVWGSRPRYAAA